MLILAQELVRPTYLGADLGLRGLSRQAAQAKLSGWRPLSSNLGPRPVSSH